MDSKARINLANESMVRTSSSLREAAKIGLQSLYADADDVLDRFKDFDLIKEMKSRKDANLLWVRARAIDADVINTNGDYFSEEELTKNCEYQGKKMPVYKTFEGVPIYTNHKNDNIEEAKGMVVYAEWDDDEKCVYCVFFIDEDAYPEIARGIRQGYIHDVSMGASVELGVCSICGNEASTEHAYCQCLKKYKGKMHPSGKRAFEYNYGVKFIELSCVGDGAFESCEILELYDQDEILQKAQKAIKAAQALNSSISLAASVNHDITSKREVEASLRQLQHLNRDFIRLAQTAGTLVGGQILGTGGAQNATVVRVLQGLGIDPSSNLNILDLVNLALNFLEVAVLNLFSRKDNIDLGHVAKLTKAMGELQNTLQDMIDDGIEMAQHGGQPMMPAQPQMAAQQAPQQPAQTPNTQTQQFNFTPSVGRVIEPFSQQPMSMPIGGGVSASNNTRIVWASVNGSEEPVEKKTSMSKFGKFAVALANLKEACNVGSTKKNEEVTNTPQNDKLSNPRGDKQIMDHFKKIAQDLKKQQDTVALSIDIKMDDSSGNRVVLSTDKGIKGYHNGQLTNWTPNLTDSQITQLESGDGYRVAADLLKDFSKMVKSAADVSTLIVMEENVSPMRTEEEVRIVTEVLGDHKGPQDGHTMQEKLESRRTNKIDLNSREDQLDSKRTHDLVRIVTELAKDARKGVGNETLEEMLHPDMGEGKASGREVMSNVMNGILKTCTTTNSKPEEVIEFLTKAASKEEFGKVLKLARVGAKTREYNQLMRSAQVLPEAEGALDVPALPQEADMPLEAVKDVADTATDETTEGEIISALNVIKENFQKAVDKLTDLLDKVAPEEETKEDEMEDALTDEEVDKDSMGGAVTGLSMAGEATGTSPDQLVDTVNAMPTDKLAEAINFARKSTANTRKASTNNLNQNIVQWLADVANVNNLDTDKLALATKFFCSYKKAATKVLNNSMRTSNVKVVDETMHSTTIYATLEEIGADVRDAAFNEKFRDFAVNLLSNSGYEVDPNTFALTDIDVSADGMVCGKVVTRATKTFLPEEENVMEAAPDIYVDEDKAKAAITPELGPEGVPSEIQIETEPIVMTAGAASARRLARLQNIIKVAQGLGLPGAPAGGAPGAAPAAPPMDMGGMAGGANDLGVGSLTGGTMGPADDMSPIDEAPEPGNKAPWGTICPQCGSKDVDIANGEGNCNGCGAQLKYKFIVEVAPPEEGGNKTEEAPMETAEAATPPVGGIGAPEAGAAAGLPGAPAGAPAAPALAASERVMTRIAYRTKSSVYAQGLSEGFDKLAAEKLPVGMICPRCASRNASKQERHTYCYDCGTLSVTNVEKVPGKAGELEATIVWI